MKISRNWLQSFFEKSLPDAQALADALTFHAFEIESVEPVTNPRGDTSWVDQVLDVKVTPNRGHDCLSHRGIAKELSAILNIPIRVDPLRQKLALDSTTDAVSVDIKTPLCARYIAGYIRGVKVGPSPEWLRTSLEAIGQRSINNVVDATNYVMFNLGQPLHAFDAARLASSFELSASRKDATYKILVRNAKDGEKILALDDNEYTLDSSMLVIVDGNSDTPIGIAGVKGGKPAGIDESTTDIIIESANFDGVSVRKTAQALKLRTDASQRFEQQISPELAAYGMKAAAELIVKLACPEQGRGADGGIVGFVDTYPKPQEKRSVSVSLAKVNNVLGTKLTGADVGDTFNRLGLSNQLRGDTFTVDVPFERLDISIPEDLVEEVGRIIGYDAVPSTQLPAFSKAPDVNQAFYAAEHVREELMAKGYSEVHNSVFAEKGERAVANKVDGARPYLRANLIDGLTEALERNVRNKDLLGLQEVKLFEIGTVWRKGKEEVVVATAGEKEKPAETPLQKFLVDAQTYEDLSTSVTERYRPFSKYPFIVRDIAMWVPESIEAVAILNVIRTNAGILLVRSELFDKFEKAGKVSFAFRLIFQSFEKTLTDEEANVAMERVYAAVKEKGWEVR